MKRESDFIYAFSVLVSWLSLQCPTGGRLSFRVYHSESWITLFTTFVVRSCSCRRIADVRRTHAVSFMNSWRPHAVKTVRVSDLVNSWAVEWVPRMQSVFHGTYARNGYGVHGALFRCYVMAYHCDPVAVASAGQPHRGRQRGGPMWALATMGRQSVGLLRQ